MSRQDWQEEGGLALAIWTTAAAAERSREIGSSRGVGRCRRDN